MRTALVGLAIACTACKPETWTVAGAEVPITIVPKTVEEPAVFPNKLGEKITLKEAELGDFEYKHDASLGIRLMYGNTLSDEDRTVANELLVLFQRDPLPNLTKQWGLPKSNDLSKEATHTVDEAKSNACWENPKNKVRACLLDTGKPSLPFRLTFRRLR